jgi:hypothetical protein
MDFKPIRNKLRKFTFDSLCQQLLNILKDAENSHKPIAFWQPLLLLKWSLEFAESDHRAKTVERKHIVSMLSQLEELEKSHRPFDLKNNGRVSKTFTILSHQQFFYQEKVLNDSFYRQIVIFSDLIHKYDINRSFKKETGLDILEFLQIFYVLWLTIHFGGDKFKYYGYLTEDVQGFIDQIFTKEKVKCFLELLTVSRETINTCIENDSRQMRNYDLQVFEASFFTRKPFLFFKNRRIIPHHDILNYTGNFFIYDFLKNRDEQFPPEFGMRLEKYVNLGLNEIALPHIKEQEIRSKYQLRRVLDFLIDDQVIIEIKGIELKPQIAINPIDKVLGNEFRKNLVKAYKDQILPLAAKLNTPEKWAIIVTYKQLYLGNSQDLWEQFMSSEIEEDRTSVLPIGNLFIIDIRTWDRLIQIIKSKKISLIEILKEIKEDDKKPKSKKFTFDMHLDKYGEPKLDLTYFLAAEAKLDQLFSR